MPPEISSGPEPFTPGTFQPVWRVAAPRSRLGDEVVILLGLSLVLVLSMVLSPHSDGITLFGHPLPATCIFRMVTGFRCPGCGLTRSFTFLGHDQVLDAFRMHPLGPFLYLLMLHQMGVRILWIWRFISGRRAGKETTATPPSHVG